MPVLRIPTPLRAYTNGQSDVTVSGANISEALTDLTTQYPTIKPHLFNDGGELRPFVNLFVGEHNIKDLQGVNTPIEDGERLMLIPSIAGGSSLRSPSLRAHFAKQSPNDAGIASGWGFDTSEKTTRSTQPPALAMTETE